VESKPLPALLKGRQRSIEQWRKACRSALLGAENCERSQSVALRLLRPISMFWEIALFFSCLILTFVCNFFFYAIKIVLHKNGYQTSLFWGYFSDIKDFLERIENEPDHQKRRNYRQLLIWLALSTLLFIAYALLLMAWNSSYESTPVKLTENSLVMKHRSPG
jgi:hypothetical protein